MNLREWGDLRWNKSGEITYEEILVKGLSQLIQWVRRGGIINYKLLIEIE